MSTGTTTAWRAAGTVRVSIRGLKQELIFTPDSDHSAKDGDSKCAVFFPVDGSDGIVPKELDSSRKGVILQYDTPTIFDSALFASANGIKVSLIVNSTYKIVGIDIPAP